MSSATMAERRPRENALARSWALVKHHVLTVYSLLAFVYLMLPIGVVIAPVLVPWHWLCRKALGGDGRRQQDQSGEAKQRGSPSRERASPGGRACVE